MAARLWLVLVALLALVGALPWGLPLESSAHAASYDPELKWRTIVTPHFHITFHGGEEELAEQVSHAAEEVWTEMTAEMAWKPRRPTEIVLVDKTDSANGYAMTLPVNTIVIYVTAPGDDSTLSFYDVWNSSILTHEFTHILHLDTVEGLPALLRGVLGRIIAVNQASPRWIVEGLATFQETRHTTAGRGRSTIVDMIKRMTALEGTFPPLGNMDGWQVAPPGGNLRYLFGQDFMQYIADRVGEDVWTDWSHTYAAGVPFLLPARRVFGMSFGQLYREWRGAFIQRYSRQAAQVEAEGLTPFRVLSDGEAACAGGSFSPDGRRIIWSCSDARDGSSILLSGPNGEDPQIELEERFATRFAWRADSKAVAFSALHAVGSFNLYEDIYFHTLGSKTVTDLTAGKRARDPAFSPDGRSLYVVTNKAQTTQLARLTVDQRLEPLTEHDNYVQIATPRPSPDGRYLAAIVFHDGQRDLWIYTADGEPYRRVTADFAMDLEPAWSADGRTLYFSSDRTGIFNIYAIDLETERLWQVSNVLGGAFSPSPNPEETALVFESYSANGSDVAWMDLDRSRWRDRGLLAVPIEEAGPLDEVLPLMPIIRPTPAPIVEQPSKKDEKKQRNKDARRETRRGGSGPRRRAPHESLRLEPGPEDPFNVPGLDGLGGPFHAPYGEPHSLRPRVDTEGSVDDTLEDYESTEEEQLDYPFSYPVHRYRPDTLFPPRYVTPSIYQTTFGFMGVLSTGGSDVLRRYIYNAYLSYRTDARFVGWGVAAAYNQFKPIVSVGAYAYTVPYGDIFRVISPPDGGGDWIPSIESTNARYWDRRIRTYAQVSYALSSRKAIFGGWNGTLRTPLDPLPADAYASSLPDRGFLSQLGGGWRYAWGHYYPYGISPEDARIISLVSQISSPYIGSYVLDADDAKVGFSQLQVTGEWREYRALPWAHNHVLAGKIAAGASFGDTQAYGSYRLGGDFGETPYYTLPDEWRALRGFAPASVYGDWFYLGTLEYRLPLLWIDRGFGILPVYLRNISAAVFTDAGYAFESATDLGSTNLGAATLVGTGAELRGEAILGWGLGLTGRLGYAFAVHGQGGYAPGSLEGLYAWLGTSF